MPIDTNTLYMLILDYVILTLIQGERDARRQTVLRHLLPKVDNGIALKSAFCVRHVAFGMLRRLADLMQLILLLFNLVSIQGRESNICDFE